jgi:hypothetical protein
VREILSSLKGPIIFEFSYESELDDLRKDYPYVIMRKI